MKLREFEYNCEIANCLIWLTISECYCSLYLKKVEKIIVFIPLICFPMIDQMFPPIFCDYCYSINSFNNSLSSYVFFPLLQKIWWQFRWKQPPHILRFSQVHSGIAALQGWYEQWRTSQKAVRSELTFYSVLLNWSSCISPFLVE